MVAMLQSRACDVMHQRVVASRERDVVYDMFVPDSVSDEPVVVLLPGWLGSQTLHDAAVHLAREGRTVVVPVHDHAHHPFEAVRANAKRARRAHVAAADATSRIGRDTVLFVGHSNGNHDAMRVVDRVAVHGARYDVAGVVSVAGVGLNGRHVDVIGMLRETANHTAQLIEHPVAEARLALTSALNYVRNPIVAITEGIGAAYIDCRPMAERAIGAGVISGVVEVYMSDDYLVRPPEGRGDFHVLDGVHMTPVLAPAVLHEAVQLAA